MGWFRYVCAVGLISSSLGLVALTGCGNNTPNSDNKDAGPEACVDAAGGCCPETAPEEGSPCCTECSLCEYDTPACPEAVPIFSCKDGEWTRVGHGDQTQCPDASDAGGGKLKDEG